MIQIPEDASSSAERVKEVIRRTLSGERDLLLTCRELADLRWRLPSVSDQTMSIFIGVSSEIDGLPIGKEREYWGTEQLKLKDVEAAEYRERVRAIVEKAMQEVLKSLERWH